MTGLHLLIGGARAGKSSIASSMAQSIGGEVTFVATAEARDDEMAQRIARHRSERPAGWTTIEEPFDLQRAIRAVDGGVTMIIDCLTLWTSNLMLSGLDDGEIEARSTEAASSAAARPGTTLVVTNEVGMGVHPSSELGRRYRDLLGRVNSLWAAHADEVLLVVAGQAMRLAPVES